MPLYSYVGGAGRQFAAGANDEHRKRRSARRQRHRFPGIHGRAGRRSDLRRGAALRGGDLPCAQGRAARGGPVDRGRRRGRVRAGDRVGREALDFIEKAVERAGYGLGERRAARARLRGQRISSGTATMAWMGEGRTLSPADNGRLSWPNSPTTIRSPRSRTAWPRTTWTAGSLLTERSATASSWSATICSSPT